MIDVIGDIHGELGALTSLLAELGYNGGGAHPEGRVLVFLGDLVDRGPYSLEVSELVMSFVREDRAVCLMGNHEYNLVGHVLDILPPLYRTPKDSNGATIADVRARPERWRPVLSFFRDLPLAVDLPGLSLIHAVRHEPSLRAVAPILGCPPAEHDGTPVGVVRAHVTLASPFDVNGLKPGLVTTVAESRDDLPHEILIKGFEMPAREPFMDNIGVTRDLVRVPWWLGEGPVVRDRLTVFGHYWNLPPIDGHFGPPHPSGHPDLRRWLRETAPRVPDRGRIRHDGDFACVDFNGLTKVDKRRACAGAYRWPEREIVWACST